MEDSLGTSNRVQPCGCPVCGKMLDAAMSLKTGDRPKVGDFTVCAYCAAVSQFCAGMILERVTIQDLKELFEENPAGILLLASAVQAVKARIRARARALLN
jgi:hypothetical protein